jgi:hypothetical protein
MCAQQIANMQASMIIIILMMTAAAAAIPATELVSRAQVGVAFIPTSEIDTVITQYFTQQVHIDLTEMRPVKADFNITQVCSTKNHLRKVYLEQCEALDQLLTLNTELYREEENLFSAIIQRLHNNFGNNSDRAKRNIYEDFLHLIDISSYSDTVQLKHKLDKINSNQLQLSQLLISNSGVLSKVTRDMQNEINRMQQTLNVTITTLYDTIYRSFRREQLIILINAQVAELRTKIYTHRIEQVQNLNKMETGLIHLSHGKITPELISPADLERVVLVIDQKLQRERLNYKVVHVTSGQLYEQLVPVTYFTQNQIIIQLQVPITHDQSKFQVYKVVILPFKPSEHPVAILEAHHESVLKLNTQTEILLVQERKRPNFIEMTIAKYLTCRQIPNLCIPGLTLSEDPRGCVPSIFLNDINTALKVCNFEIVAHPHGSVTFLNSHVIFVQRNVNIQSACKLPDNSIEVRSHQSKKDQFVTLKCSCSFQVNNISLPYRLSECSKHLNTSEVKTKTPRNLVQLSKATLIVTSYNSQPESKIPPLEFGDGNSIIKSDLAIIDKLTKDAKQARDKLLFSDETLTDLTSSIINGSAVFALVVGTVALLGTMYLYCKLSKLQSALAILTLTRPTASQSLHTVESQQIVTNAKTAQTLSYITDEITSVHQLLIILTLILAIIILVVCMKRCCRTCQCPTNSSQYKLIARLGSNMTFVDVPILEILKHHNSHLGVLLHNVDLANAISLPWTIVRAGVPRATHYTMASFETIRHKLHHSIGMARSRKHIHVAISLFATYPP